MIYSFCHSERGSWRIPLIFSQVRRFALSKPHMREVVARFVPEISGRRGYLLNYLCTFKIFLIFPYTINVYKRSNLKKFYLENRKTNASGRFLHTIWKTPLQFEYWSMRKILMVDLEISSKIYKLSRNFLQNRDCRNLQVIKKFSRIWDFEDLGRSSGNFGILLENVEENEISVKILRKWRGKQEKFFKFGRNFGKVFLWHLIKLWDACMEVNNF